MKPVIHLLVFVVAGSAVATTPLQPTLTLQPGPTATDSGFGRMVAGIGDVNGDGYADFAVGQPYANAGAATQYGRVLVYYGSPSGPGAVADWSYSGTTNFENVGYAIAGGDVNGDGFDDLIVTDRPDSGPGRIYAFFGSSAGLPYFPSWTVSPAYGDINDVTTADVDHDGYDDVLYGVPNCSRGQVHEGCALLYRGGPAGPATTESWLFESNQAEAHFGASVARIGHANADAYDDVAIGAPGYDGTQADEGRVFVFYGSATGLPATPSRILERGQAGASFGQSASPAGDANGDGFDDLAVGAPKFDAAFTDDGAVFLYLGSASGIAAASSWQGFSGQPGAQLGADVALLGDFNGDGKADLVAGATRYDGAATDSGAALVFLGDGAAFGASAAFTASVMSSPYPSDTFASSVGGAGDTNGDGFAELLIGDERYMPQQFSQPGAAWVYSLGPPHPAGSVPSGLLMDKEQSGPSTWYSLLTWPASCAGDDQYAVYEGHLGDFTSHVPIVCGAGHQTEFYVELPAFDAYYLVVPVRLGAEGSYGTGTAGAERPPSASACAPQLVAACP